MYQVGDMLLLTPHMGGCKHVVVTALTGRPKNAYATVSLNHNPYNGPAKEYLCSDDQVQWKVGEYDTEEGPLLNPNALATPTNGTTVSPPSTDASSAAFVMGSLKPGEDIQLRRRNGVETWTFKEYSPRSYRYPVIATNQNGKSYKFPLSAVVVPATVSA